MAPYLTIKENPLAPNSLIVFSKSSNPSFTVAQMAELTIGGCCYSRKNAKCFRIFLEAQRRPDISNPTYR
jgi:hypothetical protein